MLEKALGLPADETIIDLEDAVAVEQKDAAREAAVAHLASGAWRGRTVSVRVNALGTPWCHRDLIAVAGLADPPLTVIVPKVESAGDLAFVARLLDGVEAEAGNARRIRIQALIETAAGLARIDEIADASERLDAVIVGYADLANSLGRRSQLTAGSDLWTPIQHEILCAARARDLQAIDGPHLSTAVDDEFRAAATRARDLGFDGKWAIHPSQIETLNEIFTPDESEIKHARAVLDALDRAESEGAGAVALDGQMLDNAMRVGAMRTLERACRAGDAEIPTASDPETASTRRVCSCE